MISINIQIEDGRTPSEYEATVLRALAGAAPEPVDSSPEPSPEPEAPTPKADAKPSAKDIRDAIGKAESLDDLRAVETEYGEHFTPAQRKAFDARIEKLEAPTEPEGKTQKIVDLEHAVAKASEMLSQGKTDKVKAALKQLDVGRVSQLKPSQVAEFLEALGALDA